MQLAHDSQRAPQAPLPAAVPYLATAAAALAIGWAAGLTWPDRLIVPIALVALAAIKVAGRGIERHRRRIEADDWLLGAGRVSRYEWRVAELTSARERTILARSLRSLVRELHSNLRRSTVPVNRKSVGPHSAELEALADRLADLERPVEPAGMIEVERLLTSPGSPLYGSSDRVDLAETLDAIERDLDER